MSSSDEFGIPAQRPEPPPTQLPGLPPMPAQQPPVARPPVGTQLARTFIEGNWFYVLSGILMVIGCHQLVRSVMITGSELMRTTISLGILQAYELLVIATAVVIVRKLRFLGDAFTLFLVECALLLDPTFFSNSLGTISDGRGLWINAVCFILCPIKLLILQRFLRVRPTPGAWTAFLGAAALLYLAPFLLMQKQPALTMHGNYMLLGWLLLAVAVILPPLRSIASIDEPTPRYASDSQRRWLPRFWAALPLIIAANHYIESSRVYTIPFFPVFVAPVLLAISAVLANNATRGRTVADRLILMNVIAIIVICLSLDNFNVPDAVDMRRPPHAQPTLMLTSWPMVITVAGICAMYLLLWARTRSAAALWHIAALACLGIVRWIWKTGAIGRAFDRGEHHAEWFVRLLAAHPGWLFGIAAAIAIVFALRKATYIRYAIAGTLLILYASAGLPKPPGGLFSEALQAFIILGVVLSHRFGDTREHLQRLLALAVVVAMSAHRFLVLETRLAATTALTEAAFLLITGFLLRLRSYQLLAIAHAVLIGWIYLRMKAVIIPSAVLVIAAGLAMFAIAVAVTFRKAATRASETSRCTDEVRDPGS